MVCQNKEANSVFIKDIIKTTEREDNFKVIVFDGDDKNFYAWLEFLSAKDVRYLFKLDVKFSEEEKDVQINIILSGINKEFQNAAQSIVKSLRSHYKNSYGDELVFSINSKQILKEVLRDIFHIKK
jgi:hypothetical protein